MEASVVIVKAVAYEMDVHKDEAEEGKLDEGKEAG